MRRATNSNKPHRGHGPKAGRPARMKGLMAGAHLRQVDHSGDDDRTGYARGNELKGRDSAKAPKIPREAGHYHPIGAGSSRGFKQDAKETRGFQPAGYTSRETGSHTGKAPKLDQNIRKGAEGNGHGSKAPGVGSGAGRRGTPDSHLGTAGRGGSGRLGKHDGYKGKPTPLGEDLSHNWFEKFGAE